VLAGPGSRCAGGSAIARATITAVRALAIVVMLGLVAPAWAGDPGPPELASPSAIVVDVETGATLLAKDADAVRPIASMTKIFVAMVLRKRGLDLEGWTEITHVDAKAAEGGAGTRLLRGEVFRNLDLLHAMLLVSDNRVPTALARAVGMSPGELVDALAALADDLELEHTTFVDSSGILGNRSTARELARAFTAAAGDRLLARVMRTRHARVRSKSEAVTIDYRHTVRPLWDRRFKVRAGKTGYTADAGYCMLVDAEVGGRRVVMAFLGAARPSARLADFTAVARWLN